MKAPKEIYVHEVSAQELSEPKLNEYHIKYIRADIALPELPKIKGWVARDAYEDVENGVGLILHSSKPERGNEEWTAGTIMAHLPWDMFPDFKWEDEPKQVELIIREV